MAACAANHALIRQRFPLLSQALLDGATVQLRNMATVGGNLLQRTRCYYFTDPMLGPCNKREPGSGCSAIDGYNRIHAILGASPHCIAVNPSDMGIALCALDATIRLRGPQGERTIAIADFHRLPGDTPQIDANIESGELITSVDLPPSPFAAHSFYLKVRDRASYAFALVSVAAALDLQDGVVRDVRIVLGGVAHKPWRSTEAEGALRGQPLSEDKLQQAANAAVAGAQPCADNGYKIELARRAIVRAVRTAGELA
jgi:xanthine dehydrogenase YagS FAD-binding subunit